MKRCPQCEEDFNPSSRHKLCQKCRAKNRKQVCKCGELMKYGSIVCIKCSDTTGPANHNWKGGKSRHKAGYVLIRIPDHPRASSNSGYVFEHILVMEDHVGRYLTTGENIHHKNGVRDDNRIENLELWVRHQPSGQRVNDLRAWALEVLERYPTDI